MGRTRYVVDQLSPGGASTLIDAPSDVSADDPGYGRGSPAGFNEVYGGKTDSALAHVKGVPGLAVMGVECDHSIIQARCDGA